MVLNGFPVLKIDSDLGVGLQASLSEFIIFYSPWNHQKTYCFVMISRKMEVKFIIIRLSLKWRQKIIRGIRWLLGYLFSFACWSINFLLLFFSFNYNFVFLISMTNNQRKCGIMKNSRCGWVMMNEWSIMSGLNIL